MLIALLTDFGERDPYAGIMKGVILSRAPAARVVDLCHGIPAQDLRAGALALRAAVPYFPDGTLFVCVVDPGVGTRRAALWARSARHEFLAPDNGLLSWAAALEPLLEVRRLANARLFLRPLSRTFSGRDVFAPVAAARALGEPPGSLGPRLRSWRRLPLPSARRSRGGLRGEVLTVDRFGNAVTNLRPAELRRGARLRVGARVLGGLRPSYASVPAGAPLAIAGSSGFVELSVREGDFARAFGIVPGEKVYAE